MTDLSALDPRKAAKRMLAAKRARESLLDFTRLTMPDPSDMDDAEKSLYQAAIHHRAIAEALERVEKGEIRRLIISMPPRHGKSELATRRFIPWFIGRDPKRQVIMAAHTQDFSQDFGEEVREILRSQTYQQVFPGVNLKQGSQAKDNLRIDGPSGGTMFFVGIGGPITGRGADLLIIDDPVKDDKEANSPASRKTIWDWFSKTAYTRLMPGARIVIIMTRWHEDDLVGRIHNPDFIPTEESKDWQELILPAVSNVVLHDGTTKRDANGDPIQAALWPERYPLSELKKTKAVLGATGWSALFQQKPTPEDGDYFMRGYMREYEANELPPKEAMVFYGASDHAVSEKQNRDYTVMGCAGVDQYENIWIMPDLFWQRKDTQVVVDEMVALMKRHKPVNWWAGKDHITKSIGPFLRKRMSEEGAHCWIEELSEAADKRQKARPMQGMMAMKRIYFPQFAPWWPAAQSQMLKFDSDTHDDFVDFVANLCRGLERFFGKTPREKPKEKEHQPGTIGWIKADAAYRKRGDLMRQARAGF